MSKAEEFLDKELSKVYELGEEIWIDKINLQYLLQRFAKQEKKHLIESISDEMKLSISNLKDKQKAFLGTKGEVSRQSFKNGLGWVIESMETIQENLTTTNKQD